MQILMFTLHTVILIGSPKAQCYKRCIFNGIHNKRNIAQVSCPDINMFFIVTIIHHEHYNSHCRLQCYGSFPYVSLRPVMTNGRRDRR